MLDLPKKFCTTCQAYKLFYKGRKDKGSHRAWRCQACTEKRTPSIYMGKATKARLLKESQKLGATNENT